MNSTEKRSALVAAVSLIVMALAAAFSYGHVLSSIISENSLEQLENLRANTSLFVAGIAGWLVIVITDILVSVALFRFFRLSHPSVSLWTAVIRLVYTGILMIAVFQLIRIVGLVNSELSLSEADLSEAIGERLGAFDRIWTMGLTLFGIHLLGLGFLSLRSTYIPDILGYLLYLGGGSYTIISGAYTILGQDHSLVEQVEKIMAAPMALAEILLAFWLIFKALKKKR